MSDITSKADTLTFEKSGNFAFAAYLDGDKKVITLEFDPAKCKLAPEAYAKTRDSLIGAIGRFLPQLDASPTMSGTPETGSVSKKKIVVTLTPASGKEDKIGVAYEKIVTGLKAKGATVKPIDADELIAHMLEDSDEPAGREAVKQWAFPEAGVNDASTGFGSGGHEALRDGSGEHGVNKVKDFSGINVKAEIHTPNRTRPNTGVVVLRFADSAGHKVAPKPGEATKEEKIARIRELLAARPEFIVLPDTAPEGAGLDRSEPLIMVQHKTRTPKDTQSLVIDALKEMGVALDTGTGAHDILDRMMHRRRPGGTGTPG